MWKGQLNDELSDFSPNNSICSVEFVTLFKAKEIFALYIWLYFTIMVKNEITMLIQPWPRGDRPDAGFLPVPDADQVERLSSAVMLRFIIYAVLTENRLFESR